MGRCYGMAMNDFIGKGFSWYQKAWHIEYKRAIELTDRVVVRTWIHSFEKADVRVDFQILKGTPQKISADGYFVSTLINLQTGRAEPIPEWILQHYLQFKE
jgi:acyl-CoA thioester hydrolase/thioesterase-3